MSRAWPITFLILTACSNAPKDTSPRLSATEMFDLRSKCATLGEKIKRDNDVGVSYEVSRYSPTGNRCYVKLESHVPDREVKPTKFLVTTTLFDGQTAEPLARMQANGDVYSASVFNDSLRKSVHDPLMPTLTEVRAMIDKFTAEDEQ